MIHNIDWARTFFPPETVVKGAPLGGWFYPGDAPDQPNKWDPPSMWPDWSVGRVTPWDAAQKAAPPPAPHRPGVAWRGCLRRLHPADAPRVARPPPQLHVAQVRLLWAAQVRLLL